MVNQSKKHVIIPYEIKKRELDSILFLARDLISKNYIVYISSKQRINSNLDYFPKSIILLKSLGPKNFTYLKKIKSLGHIISCLDVEGVNYLEKNKLKKRASDENLNLVEYFFCWGKKMKKDMITLFPKFKEKFKLTGHPRIEILKKKNIRLYENESNKIKFKYNDFILFTTFFPTFNFFDSTKNLTQLRIKFGNNTNIGKKLQLHQKKNFFYFIDLIKKISKEFPNERLIVRPHPVENKNYWIDNFKNYKNVNVTLDDQSTCSWILSSKLLIGCNCTTLIEAYFLGKKSLNYMPYRDKSVHNELSRVCSEVIYNPMQVINIIKKKKYKVNNLKRENFKKISNIIYNNGHINSNKQIIKYFDKIKLYSLPKKKAKINFFIKKVIRFFYLFFSKKFTSSKQNQIIFHKTGNTSLSEINEKFLRISNDKLNFKIEEVLPDIFKLKKR